MRARRGVLVGWIAVVGYTLLLLVTGFSSLGDDGAARRDDEPPDPAEALVAAWERSRQATFVATGTYERRSDVSGATISSEDVVAQRPPRRLHRQLGGVEGRDDDRLIVCPAGVPEEGDEPAPCQLGAPGGLSYDESVEREVAGLRSLVQGGDPIYRVTSSEPGCFDLELRRVEPRAPFGVTASFCFDAATGAPSARQVRHAGGIVEVLVVTDIRREVRDADLEP